MKHVLLLIKGLGRGGSEQLLASSAPYWDRARFDYEVAFIVPWKTALVPALESQGVTTRCLEGERGLGWAVRLRALVRDGSFDLVHVHSPYPAAVAREVLGGRRGPKLVYTEHNVWERYKRATYWGNALTFPRNDHVFAVSEHVKASIRYPRGLRHRSMPPTETLYHGLDFAAVAGWDGSDGVREELGIDADAPLVGSVSNLKFGKGHEDLLRAALKVREKMPNVRFVVVGTGPLEDKIRALAASMDLSDTVVFTGFRDDAPRLMKAFDVFTLSSLHEGLSIALIEAMALGRPSVVTDVGGIPEVVRHGEQALLVPSQDPDALAGGILTLLADPDLRARLSAAAVTRAADFSILHAVRRQEQVYEELLS